MKPPVCLMMPYAVERPEAGAFADLFRRVERFEDLMKLAFGNAGAAVRDLDHDVVPLKDHRPVTVKILVEMDVPGADSDFAAAGHGVAGVHDEVHDDLLELALVDADRREICPVLDPERHLVGQKAVEKMRELAQRVLEVDDRRAQRLLAGEGQKLPNQGGRAVGVLPDLHQVAVFHVGHVVPHQQKVAMAVDRGQQVVEVVRHAAGELADGLHLLGLDELRFQRFQFGRVGEDGENRGRAVEDGAREGDLEEKLLPLRLAARDLRAAERAALGGVLQTLRDRTRESFDQIADLRAGNRALAQKLPGGLVGVGERAARLETRERHRQILEEMVRHEARDLGPVERIEEDVADAVGIRQNDGPNGLA